MTANPVRRTVVCVYAGEEAPRGYEHWAWVTPLEALARLLDGLCCAAGELLCGRTVVGDVAVWGPWSPRPLAFLNGLTADETAEALQRLRLS